MRLLKQRIDEQEEDKLRILQLKQQELEKSVEMAKNNESNPPDPHEEKQKKYNLHLSKASRPQHANNQVQNLFEYFSRFLRSSHFK